MAKAKPKKTKLKVVPAEKQHRYAVTRVPVHGDNFEFCDSDCPFLSVGLGIPADPKCSLDYTAVVSLEMSKKKEYLRHKVCLQSSQFVHMNIMRAKMEKMIGG